MDEKIRYSLFIGGTGFFIIFVVSWIYAGFIMTSIPFIMVGIVFLIVYLLDKLYERIFPTEEMIECAENRIKAMDSSLTIKALNNIVEGS